MQRIIRDLFDDCQVWHTPEIVHSAEEAEAYDGLELGKWYIIDNDAIPIDGPYNTESEADDALKQLYRIGRQYRGFGPREVHPKGKQILEETSGYGGDVDIQMLLHQIRVTDDGYVVNGHHSLAALRAELENDALFREWLKREPRRR